MFDFHEKRKIRSVLYSKAFIAMLFAIALVTSFSVYDRYTVAQDMQGKLEERRAELDDLKNRAHVLESKVEYLENDRGIEEELRNRFDVAKEGEQVVIIIDPKKEEAIASGAERATVDVSTPVPDEAKKSFFELLKFW